MEERNLSLYCYLIMHVCRVYERCQKKDFRIRAVKVDTDREDANLGSFFSGFIVHYALVGVSG